MDYPFRTKEEIEGACFFPVQLATKYKARYFLKLWEHLCGGRKLSNKQMKVLHKAGFVDKIKFSNEEIAEFLQKKISQKLIEKEIADFLLCQWCKCETYVLHKHHYPITKKQGGNETVNICANCHYEFHCLTAKHKYVANKEIKSAFVEAEKYKKDLLEKFISQEASHVSH